MKTFLYILMVLLLLSCSSSKKAKAFSEAIDTTGLNAGSQTGFGRTADLQDYLKSNENQQWDFEIEPLDSALSFQFGDMKVNGNVRIKGSSISEKQKESVRTIYVHDTIVRTDTITQTQIKYRTEYLESKQKSKPANRWVFLIAITLGFCGGILLKPKL